MRTRACRHDYVTLALRVACHSVLAWLNKSVIIGFGIQFSGSPYSSLFYVDANWVLSAKMINNVVVDAFVAPSRRCHSTKYFNFVFCIFFSK